MGAIAMQKRYAKIGIFIFASVLLLSLLAAGGYLVFLNGGILGTIRSLTPAPDPGSTSLKAIRAKSQSAIGAELDSIESAIGPQSYGTAKDDACNSGSHTFSRVDRYAHRCSLRLTRLFSFKGDFRRTVIDFEKALLGLGWKNGLSESRAPLQENMEYYMIHYYDKGRGPPVDLVAGPSGYHKPPFKLGLRWSEKIASDYSGLDYNQKIPLHHRTFYHQPSYQDLAELLRAATSQHQYLLSVAISTDYFEN